MGIREPPPRLGDSERLDDWSESLIALSQNGGRFTEYAASGLLSQAGVWSEVHYWMLRSAAARGDTRGMRQYLVDWKWHDQIPKCVVTQFVPGDHYHVLDAKFDTLQEAIQHLIQEGWQYGGLKLTHVYRPSGD